MIIMKLPASFIFNSSNYSLSVSNLVYMNMECILLLFFSISFYFGSSNLKFQGCIIQTSTLWISLS